MKTVLVYAPVVAGMWLLMSTAISPVQAALVCGAAVIAAVGILAWVDFVESL